MRGLFGPISPLALVRAASQVNAFPSWTRVSELFLSVPSDPRVRGKNSAAGDFFFQQQYSDRPNGVDHTPSPGEAGCIRTDCSKWTSASGLSLSLSFFRPRGATLSLYAGSLFSRRFFPFPRQALTIAWCPPLPCSGNCVFDIASRSHGSGAFSQWPGMTFNSSLRPRP